MSHPKVDEAKDKMHKAVVHLQDEFSSVRTGRASADIANLRTAKAAAAVSPLQ